MRGAVALLRAPAVLLHKSECACLRSFPPFAIDRRNVFHPSLRMTKSTKNFEKHSKCSSGMCRKNQGCWWEAMCRLLEICYSTYVQVCVRPKHSELNITLGYHLGQVVSGACWPLRFCSCRLCISKSRVLVLSAFKT